VRDRAFLSDRFRSVVLALATSNKIWLALFAGVFIVFALLSSFVFPRRRPDFPGEDGRKWFIVATLALFVAMLFAVNVFAKEDEEPHAEKAAETGTTTQPGVTESTPTETAPGTESTPTETTPGTAEGDPAAGKTLFTSQGCGGCHAFGPAGTNATVGPNLDEALQGKDAEFTREAIVDPNAEVAQGYAEGIMPGDYDQKLSDEQLADLVAFLSSS
jgi:mono/diheme cytochrome c family protein